MGALHAQFKRARPLETLGTLRPNRHPRHIHTLSICTRLFLSTITPNWAQLTASRLVFITNALELRGGVLTPLGLRPVLVHPSP